MLRTIVEFPHGLNFVFPGKPHGQSLIGPRFSGLENDGLPSGPGVWLIGFIRPTIGRSYEPSLKGQDLMGAVVKLEWEMSKAKRVTFDGKDTVWTRNAELGFLTRR